ncbi:unnamed protein product [Clonostachys rosea f. rosea IK726]|uniref:Uncharacterized protein n=1 Tax=Clonostachys rosea f. rosea IK726 TaxID=1349383 RepID=A0ACA9UML6_BIOOC|nr:unnamed protein product [Clonostachys rosea f. rosea IK726]
MSYFVNSILPAKVYNSLIVDHEATERAELVELKQKHLPSLFKLLVTHGVDHLVEVHLLHRHFTLHEGEALVHRTLYIAGSEGLPGIHVDVAKAVSCPQSIDPFLIPLLWMASSDGALIAYEYGLQDRESARKRIATDISSEKWISFAQNFSTYVHSAGIADIVSLKDKSCVTGGEYVVPGMRVLFRVPTEVINLQQGSGMLESGWGNGAAAEPDAGFPECTDGHVTKTRQTSGGTVAHYHDTTEDGIDAFNEKEVPPLYTSAMWNAAKSGEFWAVDRLVDVLA